MSGVAITGGTKIVAVIGSPVAHSLSPAIHNAAFERLGIDWRMVAFDVAEHDADSALAAMATLGIAGYAVTTPLKAAIAGFVDVTDDASSALRSVNTVVRRADGSLQGASTDGDGFVASLNAAGVKALGQRIVVLGAGGAARSIVDALGRAGAADIAIVNRTAERAEDAATLADVARVASIGDVGSANIIVNATSVGMGDPEATPVLDASLLRVDQVVADIVYHPLDTLLLRDAAKVGARTISGLSMLVEQARLQQLLWTGQSAPSDVMTAAAQAQLARR